MVSSRPTTRHASCRPMAAGVLLPQPLQTASYPRWAPRYAGTPCSPLWPLIDTPAQPTSPVYYLVEPGYGFRPHLPHTPPAPHLELRDVELAYMRGQLASMGCCSTEDHLSLPQVATYAPPLPPELPQRARAAAAASPEAKAARRCSPRAEMKWEVSPVSGLLWPSLLASPRQGASLLAVTRAHSVHVLG